MAKEMVIFDTNILIEIYKGNPITVEEVKTFATDEICITAITAAEFLVGAKDKADFARIQKHLKGYTVIPVNEAISDIFLTLFNAFSLSHRPEIADALIAATALYHRIPLLTYNKRHFQYFPGITLL